MRFPIDVVYLDRAGMVVHLVRDLQPWRFSPVRMQAASVLELPRHTVGKTETALGDHIEIKIVVPSEARDPGVRGQNQRA